MSADLKGRTALVTGSTSGIGEATANALAARGAHVLVVGGNEERAEQIESAIEGNEGRASLKRSETTEEEFRETFDLNVKVPFFLVAALARVMAQRGSGSIVNISTQVASFGQAGLATYGASRAALELLTKAWAPEYGPSGVRVDAVAPGPTRTRIVASDDASLIHGVTLAVDGGRTAV